MPRTIVPPSPSAGMRSLAATEAVDQKTAAVGDRLPEKLVKYVPAETLAFFVPVAAAIGPERQTLLIIAVLIAAMGTVGYLWWHAQSLPQEQRPVLHFFVLAEIAFACWAVATVPNVAMLVGVNATTGGVILAFAVFLIPITDNILTRRS